MNAQHLACYNDNLNKFWIFDNGNFQMTEHLEIQSYDVGGTLIAYLNSNGNLKVYDNGEVETLLIGNPIKYEATDYLLGYSLYEQLFVYDQGESQKLSNECDKYIIEDSLIVWHNKIKKTIDLYYEGEVRTIEDALVQWSVNSVKTGDNILAYVTEFDKKFKVFYHGELQVLDPFTENIQFEAGRDIVAYTDVADERFYVFYNNEIIEIESFPPESFKVGFGIVAYIDNMGKFKYFKDGKVFVISNFKPDFYEVQDFCVLCGEQGFMKTYYNNEPVLLERYIPRTYGMSYNTIGYLNETNFVKAFQHGVITDISYAPVKEIKIFRDLIIYYLGGNTPKIFYNGQLYQN